VTASGDKHGAVSQRGRRLTAQSVIRISSATPARRRTVRYRDQSFVNALQWAIGLEIFLSVRDPWRSS